MRGSESRRVFQVGRAQIALGLVVVVLAAFVASPGVAGAGAADGALAIPADVPEKGLVYDGLTRSPSCPGAFVTRTTGLCTPGPMSIDMHADALADAHAAATGHAGHADHATAEPDVANDVPPVPPSATPSGALCDGDGTSGSRVQVVYAREPGTPDRYEAMRSSIQTWAAGASDIFDNSAAKTGGRRHIRFVHDASCAPTVLNVVMAAGGDDNFDNTIAQLRGQGYNLTNRKYMVFVDANVLCGIGNLYDDSSPGASNWNNRGPSYSRTDAGCWGSHTAAHELTHNLGGVQLDAPHSSGGFHCVDEYDVMCYSDSPNYPTMQITCSPRTTHEALLDCGNDDYFHTSPPAGSYLATHWNVANSAYLFSTAAPSFPGPPNGATASPGNARATVTWTAPASNGGAAINGYTVTSSPGASTCAWTAGPLSCTVTGLTNGTAYTFTVRATNAVGAGPPSSPSAAVTPLAGDAIAGRVTEAGSGVPLPGIVVRVWNQAGALVTSRTTGSDGRYTVPGGLPAGPYRLRFHEPSGAHLLEFHNNKALLEEANPVTVSPGSTTAVDAELGLALGGRITTDGTGAPIANATVRVWDGAGVVVAVGTTAADGSYRFGLPPGAYRIRAHTPTGSHVLEFYSDKATLATATPVVLSSGAAAPAVADMALSSMLGTLAGVVTEDVTGAPLAGISVRVWDASGVMVRQVSTGADGSYAVTGLPSGAYRLRFHSPTGGHLLEFFDAAATLLTATPIVVAAPSTSTANISLAPA